MSVLLGEENYLKEKYLQQRGNLDKYYPKNFEELNEAVKKSSNVSLFNNISVIYLDEYKGSDCSPLLSLIEKDGVFIVAQKMDKRTKLYKSLLKEKEIKEFNPLTGYKLKNFIKEIFEKNGQNPENKIVEYMIYMCGNNLFLIENEISKLCLQKNGEKIVLSDVEESVLPHKKHIFEKVDALVLRKPCDFSMMENEIYQIYYMAIKQLRIVSQVKGLLQKGKNPKDIRKIVKQHPFVVDKAIKQAKIIDPFRNLKDLINVEVVSRQNGSMKLSLKYYLRG